MVFFLFHFMNLLQPQILNLYYVIFITFANPMDLGDQVHYMLCFFSIRFSHLITIVKVDLLNGILLHMLRTFQRINGSF